MLQQNTKVENLTNYTHKFGIALWLFVALPGAAVCGFMLSEKPAGPDAIVEASFQAPTSQEEQMGRIKAEIVALQSMFSQLAEVANLHGGEFDLDADPFAFDSSAESTADQAALLIDQIDHMSSEAGVLKKIFIERRIAHNHEISGKPLVDGRKSSGYGYRSDPISGNRALHRGVDFKAPVGTPIYSLADGVVSYSGKNGSYGNLVEIDHGAGYRTRYAHNKANMVSLGEHVTKDQMIATLGSTGKSTGAHVHVEVRLNGKAIDPSKFIQ